MAGGVGSDSAAAGASHLSPAEGDAGVAGVGAPAVGVEGSAGAEAGAVVPEDAAGVCFGERLGARGVGRVGDLRDGAVFPAGSGGVAGARRESVLVVSDWPPRGVVCWSVSSEKSDGRGDPAPIQ